jgi:tetratricopeptide (TPR) repeat protein
VALRQGDSVLALSVFGELEERWREGGTGWEGIQALGGLGSAERQLGNLSRARTYLTEALALARQSRGGEPDPVNLLIGLAEIAWAQDDSAGQRAFYEDAQVSIRQVTAPVDRARLAGPMSWIACRIGDYDGAEAWVREEFEFLTARARDDPGSGPVLPLIDLAEVARCRGDWDRAESLLLEALVQHRERGDRWGSASALHNLGNVALSQGDANRARALFIESLALYRELGFAWSVADCVMGLAAVVGLKGRPDVAALLYGAAEVAHESIDRSGGTYIAPGNALAWKWEMAAAQGGTDDETWRTAWRRGQGMSIDEALRHAGLMSG